MTPLRSIARLRLWSLKNQALNLKKDSLTKILVVLFGLGNVLGIGYWVSHQSFEFIEGFSAFGSALNSKLISLLFFAILVLVILSTTIVAYTTAFLARESEFLFQFPVKPRLVLGIKLAEAIGFSSWATLFLCLPVLVAYGRLRHAPVSYYFEAAFVLGCFLFFAGLVGSTIAMALAPIVRRWTLRRLVALAVVALAGIAWLFLRSFRLWDMDGDNNLLILDRFASQLSTIHSPYFPSNWAALAVNAAAVGNHPEVLFQSATLLANTLIFLPILAVYGKRVYGGQWLASRSARGTLSSARGLPSARATAPNELPADPRFGALLACRGPLRTLAWKDVLVFVRDPSQLSQSILFVLLMLIYSLSLVRIPEILVTGNLRNLVHFANLGAVCAILSSFTSRFLFPLVSLEGKAFWLVGLAPVPRSAILREKAAFGFGISVLLGAATTITSNVMLRSSWQMHLGAVYTVFLAAVCLNALAAGLGSAYPNFEEDNPARIAVGLGGTLNFFASALTVSILIAIEALPYLLLDSDPGLRVLAAHGAALLFTLGLTWGLLRLGARSLERRDF